jgi:hypothetical protein
VESTVNETSGGAPPAPSIDWRLTIVHHAQAACIGRSLGLHGLRTVPLGRQSPAFGPGVLDDERASREHAVIEVDGARLALRDLGSRNGTLVNGTLLAGERALAYGDLIQVGPVVFEVRYSGPGAPSPPAVLEPADRDPPSPEPPLGSTGHHPLVPDDGGPG